MENKELEKEELEPVLEAILESHNESSEKLEAHLDLILEQLDNNNNETVLDAILMKADEASDSLKAITENTKQKEVQKIEIMGIDVVTLKGKDGKDGEKGEKGDKGDTGTAGEKGEKGDSIVGAKGEKGEKGDRGTDGKDGIDGKEGKTGRAGAKGKDGSPDTGKEIVTKLSELKGKERLSYDSLKDTPIYNPHQASKTVSLVELDDVDYSGLTLTNGKYILGSGGGGGGGTVVTDNINIDGDGSIGDPITLKGIIVADGIAYRSGASVTNSADFGRNGNGMWIGTAVGIHNSDTSTLTNGTRLIEQNIAKLNISGGADTPDPDTGANTGTQNTYFGVGAGRLQDMTLNPGFNTYIGTNAGSSDTSGSNNVIIGANAATGFSTGSSNLVLGTSSFLTNGTGNFIAGTSAGFNGTPTYSIAMGYQSGVGFGIVNNTDLNAAFALGSFSEATQSNQLVVGGAGLGTNVGNILEGYFGGGVFDSSDIAVQPDFTFRTTNGNGTDISATSMFFKGGAATGNATGGHFEWATSDAGASGATLQSFTNKMVLATTGAFRLNKYGVGTFTGTPTKNLSVDANGNVIESVISSGIGDGDYGDITVSGAGSVMTIDNDVVSTAKMANVASSTVFYRKTAGIGDPEVQTLATLKTDLGLTGTNSGDQTITLTSDVTGSGTGSFATTIASDAVTNTKLANMATQTFKGRTTAGTGDPEDLTVAQAKTMLGLPTTYTDEYDFYIRKNGSNFEAIKLSDFTIPSTNADASVVMQYAVDQLDGATNAGGGIFFEKATYTMASEVTIAGNDTSNSKMIRFHGSGNGATIFLPTSGVNCIAITARAKVSIRDIEIQLKGASIGIRSFATTSNVRAFWQSEFRNIYIQCTDGSSTGTAMSLGNPFRSVFENIEMNQVKNGVKLFAEGNTFNPGDCTFTRMFIELPTGSGGFALNLNGNVGTSLGNMNQNTFNMVEMYAGGTNQTGILIDGTAGGNHNRFTGINLEQFLTVIDIQKGRGNNIVCNYVTSYDVGTVFKTSVNAFDNQMSSSYIDVPNAVTYTVINDANTVTTQPNRFVDSYIGPGSATVLTVTKTNATLIERFINNSGTSSASLDYTALDAKGGRIYTDTDRTSYIDTSTNDEVGVMINGNDRFRVKNTYVKLLNSSTAGQYFKATDTTGNGQWASIAQSEVTNLTTDLAAKQIGIQFKDEGSNLGASATANIIDFVGSGVTATRVSDTVTVTVGGSIVSINSDTTSAQLLAVGTSGTDFAVVTSAGTHTFNLPDASATARGVVTTGTQTFAGVKTFNTDVGIGATPTYRLDVGDTFSGNFGTQVLQRNRAITSISSNSSNPMRAFEMDATSITIPVGVTESSYRVAARFQAQANTTGMAGTLADSYALWCRSGIELATAGAVITNSYGLYAQILNSVAGTTLTNAYGVFITNAATTGTITNRFDLYAASSNAKNYLAGTVGIGTTTQTAKLSVLSTTEQQRTLYDASNYESKTVGSTGIVTYDAVGSGSSFVFSDQLTVGTTSNGSVTTAAGVLQFYGTGDYQVATGDRYVFRHTADTDIGLQFNTTNSVYRFTNSTATSMMDINYTTGDTYQAGGMRRPIATTSSASYTATTSNYTILCNTTSNNITLNLPAASSNTGRVYNIKKIAAANTLTIDANASELIDGATTLAMTTNQQARNIVCDGTGWHVISGYL